MMSHRAVAFPGFRRLAVWGLVFSLLASLIGAGGCDWFWGGDFDRVDTRSDEEKIVDAIERDAKRDKRPVDPRDKTKGTPTGKCKHPGAG